MGMKFIFKNYNNFFFFLPKIIEVTWVGATLIMVYKTALFIN